MSGTSFKPVRRQTRRSKKSSTPPGYQASDESMPIPSDISDTSEWEWIAGGFPCRDVVREHFISDSNELELLGVVWAVEHYKNYLYGSEFEVITDHKALLSALSPNHGKKHIIVD